MNGHHLLMAMRRRGRGTASGGGGAIEDGWSTTRDFNTGTIGNAANAGGNGFDDIAGDSRYTTEQVYEGAQACKCSITSGSEGNGTWGGAIYFPSSVGKLGNLWIRQYIYMPSSFLIDTPGNGSLKYIRVRMKQDDGTSNAGFFDLQFKDDDETSSDFRMIKESWIPELAENWEEFGANGVFPRNQWVEHILHIKLDDVRVSGGGTSRIRFWQNGTKLVDSTAQMTMVSSTDYADALYLFTYWNGFAPQTQSLYLDAITVASHTLPSWAVSLP